MDAPIPTSERHQTDRLEDIVDAGLGGNRIDAEAALQQSLDLPGSEGVTLSYPQLQNRAGWRRGFRWLDGEAGDCVPSTLPHHLLDIVLPTRSPQTVCLRQETRPVDGMVPLTGGGQGGHRKLAASLQWHAPAFEFGKYDADDVQITGRNTR